MKRFVCLFFILLMILSLINPIKVKAKENKSNDTIYILAIGNSHTGIGYKYLYKILSDAGYKNIIVGTVFIKGSTMQSRYKHFINDDKCFTYLKYTKSKPKRFKNISLSEVLDDEKWNYIIMQQNSYRKCSIDNYTNNEFNISIYLDKIQKHNKSAKIGLFIPWSKDYLSNNRYFNSIKEQYNCIQNTAKELLKYDKRITFSINIGKVIKKVRKLKRYKDIDILRKDNTHLSHGPSMFIASYSIATYFGITRNDISWYPTLKFDKRITKEYNKKIYDKLKKTIDNNIKE